MENKEDCYKIIGTSREAIAYKLNQGKSNNEIDSFLQEKCKDQINLIKRKISLMASDEKKEEFIKEICKIQKAYEQVKSQILREKYNQKLDEKKHLKETDELVKQRTAYAILNTSEDALNRRTEKENDSYLRERRDKLLLHYSEMLKDNPTFSDKAKIQLEISKIEEAYQLVMTADNRLKYRKYLEKEKEKITEKIRKKKIEKFYSHATEYKPGLIANKLNSNPNLLDSKMVTRKERKLPNEYLYEDSLNRRLTIKETACIFFTNFLGANLHVNEYEIKRKIDGKEKVDIVYTDSPILNLSIDSEKKQRINSEYYNCVINQLLSEDTIEGAQYNSGYIGKVEKDENGKYNITLKNAKLKSGEQEMLTAVMIIQKQRQKSLKKLEGKNK